MSKKKSSKKVIAKVNASKSELKNAHSKIEMLTNLVDDKESLIDNLIARAGELESSLLDNVDLIDNLNNEILQQKNHIDSLNNAIKQRDDHVAHLEARTSKALDLLAQKEKTLESNDKLTNAIIQNEVMTNKCLDLLSANKSEEKLEEIAARYDRVDSLISEYQADFRDHLDKEQRQSKNRHKSQIRNFSLLKEHSKQVSSAVDKTTTRLEYLSHLLSKAESTEVAALSKTITKLENDLAYRDNWGGNVQARLHELNQEISSIKGSFSWRLMSLSKYLCAAPRLITSALVKIAKTPYRILTKLGWRFAPKLFHKIYHTPSIAKLLNRQTKSNLSIEQDNHTVTEADVDNFITSMTPNKNHSEPNHKSKWHTGTRIDGPGK